jgi:sterol desaturase/sphingolipid hydroxylase (fatty acid hydroxylase superfamily)
MPEYTLYLLLAAGPIFGIFMWWEWRAQQRRAAAASAQYTLVDTASNLTLAGLFELVQDLWYVALIPIYQWFYQFRIATIETTVASFLVLLVLHDFLYYWSHRAHHRIRLLWAIHVTHHSSPRYNLSTALRQNITYPLVATWIIWLPLILIGFDPITVIFVVALNLFYQFFVHTQMVTTLGPLEWIFNTPSHHRVHHGRNAQYIDRNYGGIFIIWDRLFGTFTPEREAVDYGITHPVDTHNPIVLIFHEWIATLRDAAGKGLTLRQRLNYLLKPPGWSAFATTDTPPVS